LKKQPQAAREWATDPTARQRINEQLADLAYDPMDVLSLALDDPSKIDEIDRRIASLELRRIAALRTIEQYNDRLARRPEAASPENIDGRVH
jgi:hypothetical protein